MRQNCFALLLTAVQLLAGCGDPNTRPPPTPEEAKETPPLVPQKNGDLSVPAPY